LERNRGHDSHSSERAGVSPGGHLLTTTAAAGAVALSTGAPASETLALAAGIVTGGFLIDVDHALDYVVVERQRDLRPRAFLRYYLGGRARRTVLVLHSYEVFALLGALAWWLDSPALWGYLAGALMHLALDIVFNGEQTPRSIAAFYSFGYRLAHRFDSQALLGPSDRAVPAPFWTAFFAGATVGAPPRRPERRARAAARPETSPPVA
jgi:hypothetical protein